MRFVHCSDLHLGASRFGNERLRGDLTGAFMRMVEDVIERDVDAVIICGDVFDRFGADLLTLHEAEGALVKLKDSGIETIAIEGDHDIFFGRDASWLRFLARRGLVKLLEAWGGESIDIREWSEERGTGAFVDVEGARFFGIGHRVEAGLKSLRLLGKAIEPADLTVAMMHAGIGPRNSSDPGSITAPDSELLREKVDYLALGHVHRRFSIDGWIYNPGGLENWRPEECISGKGYFLVDVRGADYKVQAVDSVRRAGHLISVDVSGLDTDAAINGAIKAAVMDAGIDPSSEPVVSVDLVGRPRFDLSRYDGGSMCSWIISRTGAVECLVNDRTIIGPSVTVQSADAALRAMRSRIGTSAQSPNASRMTPEERADLILRLPDAFRGMTGDR
jgi:DNA repair exonuclease SbcCD nuclease subunit